MPDKQHTPEHLINIADYCKNGDFQKAEALCKRLLHDNPSDPDLLYHLGVIEQNRGHYKEAIEHLRRATQIQPDNTAAKLALGLACLSSGFVDQALSCFNSVVSADPGCAEAFFYLATVYQQQGLLDDAERCYNKVLNIRPDHAESFCNLGTIYDTQDRLDDAVSCYKRAVSIKPDYAIAHNNLGTLLQRLGLTAEAGCCYDRALRLHPDNILWQIRRASLCPDISTDSESITRVREKLLADLDNFSGLNLRVNPNELVTCGIYPSYALMYHGVDDRRIRESYAQVFLNCFPRETPAPGNERPRVGFVVTRGHEGIFLKSMGGILKHANRDCFEPVIICSDSTAGEMRTDINDQSIRILPVPGQLDQMADVIRSAAFDILYYWEIATDSTNYFLPFYRLAPVQCTSWGIQVTSGIPTVDYYLSSSLAEPPAASGHYSERLLCADTLLTYQYRTHPPDDASREYFGLPQGYNLYICVQQLGKLHPDFDNVFADILRRDKNGLIVLTRDKYGNNAEALADRFRKNIPDVADRIIFLPRQSRPDYLRLIDIADVILDPPFYGGVNTSYDGFSLNKPIVTLPSSYHIGRYTAACYWKMGYTDCVAENTEDYIDIAVSLGTDKEHRMHTIDMISRVSQALFEDMQAVREHERLFELLYNSIRH